MSLPITVFTPTYNRAYLLPRLFESLCKQTFKNFEWLIVDDGSTDNTAEVVERLQNHPDRTFPVRYYKKENGGKHTAINLGVKEARGELFFIADSDDILPPDSLENVIFEWKSIKDNRSFGGICGLDSTFEGKLIGSGLPFDKIDGTSIDVRFRLGVTGDMKEVFRVSVLKEFPFPEINGERFCPEVLVWNRIATKYQLRYINQIVYMAEYQQDGITSTITRSRMESPIASTMTYAEMLEYDIPLKEKVRSAINYWRFWYCGADSSLMPKVRWYWQIARPAGYLMHLRDNQTAKYSRKRKCKLS